MARGLTVYKRVKPQTTVHKHDVIQFVVAEYDTETEEQKELATGSSLEHILKQVPYLEKIGNYDSGVVIDLTSVIE